MREFTYKAYNLTGNTWIIKRFKPTATNADDESNYDEAEIVVDTKDPHVAIQAAVKRGSWS